MTENVQDFSLQHPPATSSCRIRPHALQVSFRLQKIFSDQGWARFCIYDLENSAFQPAAPSCNFKLQYQATCIAGELQPSGCRKYFQTRAGLDPAYKTGKIQNFSLQHAPATSSCRIRPHALQVSFRLQNVFFRPGLGQILHKRMEQLRISACSTLLQLQVAESGHMHCR